MLQDIKKDAKQRMEKSAEALKSSLTKIRTGRASPAILDHVKVDYYGTATPLKQVANVVATDARSLSITPWERPMVPAIEKAIMEADLGFNPVTTGDIIRVPMPPLTEERRRDLVKLVKAEGEQGKVSVRNIRRDAISMCKDLLKDKDITEDEDKRFQDEIQKVTDDAIAVIDAIISAKEAEVMEV